MLKGALVAIITPFKDGGVDEEALRELIEFQIAGGTDGIVPCGTTGESATLSHEEHKRVIEITVDAVKKRVPVVAGAGSNNTREAVDLTLFAKQAGADAALHITPYYNKPTQEGIYRHFAAISQASGGFPLVPYNIASRTGVNILPATMARIAGLAGVVAVKEASGDLNQMAEIVGLCGGKVALLSGDDAMLLGVLAIGGQGVISVVNNLVPRDVSDILAAWNRGDIATAQAKFHRLLPLVKAMFLETNPIPVKTAAALMGLIPSGELRLPMCEMAPDSLAKLKAALTAYGLKLI
ncbi:MAG: 4-hydroxy-tetrahydrodipicolinate synthase [Desulfarculus sp.]|nr:4-hydroxy-tetrahydrodipicolinate synthase [Desulfarculus sp.]